jgi:hypothetical protein
MSDPSGSVLRALVDRSQPAASAIGLSSAALIMTIFGFVWLGWGFSVSQAFTDFSATRLLPAARWITFYVVFLALLGISIQALRRAHARWKVLAVPSDVLRSRFNKPFRAITFFEGTGCIVVVFLAVVFHRLDLLAAGISLVVGVHFLPLAWLFQFSAYYVAGVAIMLCDLVSVAALRAEAITFAVGVATGVVLWITAVYALFLCRGFLREVAAH